MPSVQFGAIVAAAIVAVVAGQTSAQQKSVYQACGITLGDDGGQTAVNNDKLCTQACVDAQNDTPELNLPEQIRDDCGALADTLDFSGGGSVTVPPLCVGDECDTVTDGPTTTTDSTGDPCDITTQDACDQKKRGNAFICKWDTDIAGTGTAGGTGDGGASCARNNRCENVMDPNICRTTDGCKLSTGICVEDDGTGEDTGTGESYGGDDQEGECVDNDLDDALCKAKKSQTTCNAVQDKGCKWGKAFAGSVEPDACYLDPEFDKYNCAEKTGSQCQSNTFKDKCFWDEESKVCEKLATTPGLDNLGGGTGDDYGQGGGTDDCDPTDPDCESATVVDESACEGATKQQCDEAENDDGLKLCTWELNDSPDTSGNSDGSNGDSASYPCYQFTDKAKCDEKKDDQGVPVCEWASSTVDNGGETDDSGNPVDAPGAGGSTCMNYDLCGKYDNDLETCESLGQCEVVAETFCQAIDNEFNSEDDVCAEETSKNGCESVDDEGATSNIRGENPICMWMEYTRGTCANKDACYDKYKNDKAKCNAKGGSQCTFNEGFDGQPGSCAIAEPDTGESSNTVSCSGYQTEDDCTKQKGCDYRIADIQECQMWRGCAHFTQSACEGGEETCWWDAIAAFCYVGKKPTTQSTTTTSTSSSSSSSTSSSSFHCDENFDYVNGHICRDTNGENKCIPGNYKCDGTADCADESDEADCKDTTKRTTRTTTTRSTTVTTLSPCVKSSACANENQLKQAMKAYPPLGVPLKCRVCANPDQSEQDLCSRKATVGCGSFDGVETTARPTTEEEDIASTPEPTEKPDCVINQQCSTPERFFRAQTGTNPSYSTTLECRLCAQELDDTKANREMLCDVKKTTGCAGDAEPLGAGEVDEEEKKRAKKVVYGFWNAKGVTTAPTKEDIYTALNDIQGVRIVDIIDVEIEKSRRLRRATSDGDYVVALYTSRYSGLQGKFETDKLYGMISIKSSSGATIGAMFSDIFYDTAAPRDDSTGYPPERQTQKVAVTLPPDDVFKRMTQTAKFNAVDDVLKNCVVTLGGSACTAYTQQMSNLVESANADISKDSEFLSRPMENMLLAAKQPDGALGMTRTVKREFEDYIALLQRRADSVENEQLDTETHIEKAETRRDCFCQVKYDADGTIPTMPPKCTKINFNKDNIDSSNIANNCEYETSRVKNQQSMSAAQQQTYNKLQNRIATANQNLASIVIIKGTKTSTDDDDAETVSPTPADPENADGSKESGKGDDGAMTMIIIIVIVVIVLVMIGVIVAIVMRNKNKNKGGRPNSLKTNLNVANPAYEASPQYAHQGAMPGASAGTPTWADPAVPFLSRAQAEAQLKSLGNINGQFVVRQSTSVIKGYVITSVSDGKYSNIQLKRTGDSLVYGTKTLGSGLQEALHTLRNSIPVSPSGAAHYFLKDEAGTSADADA